MEEEDNIKIKSDNREYEMKVLKKLEPSDKCCIIVQDFERIQGRIDTTISLIDLDNNYIAAELDSSWVNDYDVILIMTAILKYLIIDNVHFILSQKRRERLLKLNELMNDKKTIERMINNGK